METAPRKPGRPKTSERTLPLVLDADKSLETLMVSLPEPTAKTLADYVAWVRNCRNMSAEEAITATVDYALREVFRRDRLWRDRGRREGDAEGRTVPPAAPRPFVPSPTALPEPKPVASVANATARAEIPTRVPPTAGKA